MKFVTGSQQAVSDASIVEQVLKGESAAYEQLMRKYNQRLFRVGISYLQDDKDVEDAMQSTYLNAYRMLGSFQRDASFSTWITRIMINECLQLLRRQSQFKMIDISGALPEKVVTFESGEETLIKQEMKLLLEKAVLNLPPKYRSVYMLREVEEMSTLETAEALNISDSNVKIRLHRAKEMLREEIMRRTGEVGIFYYGASRCDMLVAYVLAEING